MRVLIDPTRPADVFHHYLWAGSGRAFDRTFVFFLFLFSLLYWLNLRRNLCHKQKYYRPLLHRSSQCRGTLRSLAWVVVRSTPASSVAKRRQRLWRTISLLINTTNAGNKYIVKRHTMWSYFFVLASSRVIRRIMHRPSPVIVENKPLQGEARHLRCASVCPVWAYFPDNGRRSMHYPLLITRLFSML